MGQKRLEVWLFACLPCMRLLVWAKDFFRRQRRGPNALQLSSFCLRLGLLWIPGSESYVPRRDAGLFLAMNKDKMSQRLRRSSASFIPQEHPSHRTEENRQFTAFHSAWEEWLGRGVACREGGPATCVLVSDLHAFSCTFLL